LKDEVYEVDTDADQVDEVRKCILIESVCSDSFGTWSCDFVQTALEHDHVTFLRFSHWCDEDSGLVCYDGLLSVM